MSLSLRSPATQAVGRLSLAGARSLARAAPATVTQPTHLDPPPPIHKDPPQ